FAGSNAWPVIGSRPLGTTFQLAGTAPTQYSTVFPRARRSAADDGTAESRASRRTTGSARLTGAIFSGLRDARFECGAERLAHRVELDPVEHVLEEAAHDQPLGLGAREPARHQVEELVAVDAPERRAVGAADVVRHDLEPGDRVRVRVGREQEVAVLLVGVRLLRVGLDPDHPAPHRPRGL